MEGERSLLQGEHHENVSVTKCFLIQCSEADIYCRVKQSTIEHNTHGFPG